MQTLKQRNILYSILGDFPQVVTFTHSMHQSFCMGLNFLHEMINAPFSAIL